MCWRAWTPLGGLVLVGWASSRRQTRRLGVLPEAAAVVPALGFDEIKSLRLVPFREANSLALLVLHLVKHVTVGL